MFMKSVLNFVLFCSLVLSLKVYSQSKVTLISDIDDTIKRTHIVGNVNLWRADLPFSGGASVSNEFSGLSIVYRSFYCQNENEDLAESCMQRLSLKEDSLRQVSYVTGAPGKLVALGAGLISNLGFPAGEIFGRPDMDISTGDFKKQRIESLIRNMESDREIILVGDNGEHDPEVFHHIEKLFPDREITSFVHVVYGTDENVKEEHRGAKLFPGQIPFITSVDLGIHLLNRGLIKEEVLLPITDKVIELLSSKEDDDYEQVIPKWMDCSEYMRDTNFPAPSSTQLLEKLDDLQSLLQRKCVPIQREEDNDFDFWDLF